MCKGRGSLPGARRSQLNLAGAAVAAPYVPAAAPVNAR